jgi:hypothetical protein
MSFGRQVVGTAGTIIQVLASSDPEWASIGITIDWASVVAVSGADATYEDGTVVKVGKKGIPFGTILCREGVAEVQTVTLANATGGTFTLTLSGQTTAAIAYNASAATVQAALEALSNVGVGKASVSGSAGGPYTGTFDRSLGNVAQMTADATSLTSGTTATVTVATTTAGNAGGLWGPYASGATDGRASVTRGNAVILNETILEDSGLAGQATDITGALEGGMVWRARLRVGGSGQPSWAAFEAAFPRIRYAQ